MIRAIFLSLALLVPRMLAAQQGNAAIDFALDDPAMSQARAEAHASLPLLLAYALDGTDGFAGFLANSPNFMGDLKEGDGAEFTRDMVRDWSFTGSTGLFSRNYSTRVMLGAISPDEAAYFTSFLPDNPVPMNWK